jgi:RNA-directed DNA polymerase
MAVYLVLMPICEADFHPQSYGFRPRTRGGTGRRSHSPGLADGADRSARPPYSLPTRETVGRASHRELLRQVARRVSDGMILKLIKGWLRAPILEVEEGGGQRLKANACGTPQGGVISPLLANIYLRGGGRDKGGRRAGEPHPLDEAVNDRCGKKFQMVRYADDLVILCPTARGAGVKEQLARWLQAKGLALNEQKTRVVQSRQEGFSFLGFTFRWQQSKRQTPYVHMEPSPSAQQALRDAVRALTPSTTTGRTAQEVVSEINQVVRGWGN